MYSTLFMEGHWQKIGKLNEPFRIETVESGSKSKHLHVRDRKSGLIFLIDTGADVSLLPESLSQNSEPSAFTLYAANNSRFATFGTKHMSLILGLKHDTHVHDFSSNLSGKTIFTNFHQAYNQIPVAVEDIPKAAVITLFGLFEFPVMTFGLRNAIQTFQRDISKALGDLDYVFAYVDDILIFSSSVAEHKEHLREVFKRLKKLVCA